MGNGEWFRKSVDQHMLGVLDNHESTGLHVGKHSRIDDGAWMDF